MTLPWLFWRSANHTYTIPVLAVSVIIWSPDWPTWTVNYIRDCRKSPNCTFLLFPHLVKSTTYKSRLVAKLKVLEFSDSLYFNPHFSSWEQATKFCAEFPVEKVWIKGCNLQFGSGRVEFTSLIINRNGPFSSQSFPIMTKSSLYHQRPPSGLISESRNCMFY